jgi:hypothetical protein
MIALVFALIGGMMATNRNRNPYGWAILCFFTSIFGLILLAIVGKSDSKADGLIPYEGLGTAFSANYDRKKWEVLKEVDPDIRRAAHQAAEVGPHCENELAEKYLSVNSKEYLTKILDNAIENAKLSNDEIEPEQISTGENLLIKQRDRTYKVISGPDAGKRFEDFETVVEYYELSESDWKS